MANYTVSGNKTEKYKVKKDGASKVSGVFGTQKEAERAAKQFAGKTGGGEVRIKGLDGKIRDSDTVSPARDPNPPTDKRH